MEIRYNSSLSMESSDSGDLIYFIVNVEELFKVNLSYPGILNILKKAFNESKKFIPVWTGLMKSSYTMDRINNTAVMIYFDPQKILGKKRLGRVVKVYYPKYLKDKSTTFNWLDIIMKAFYRNLIAEAEALMYKIELSRSDKKDSSDSDSIKALALASVEKKNTINILAAVAFFKLFKDEYERKIKKYKKEVGIKEVS